MAQQGFVEYRRRNQRIQGHARRELPQLVAGRGYERPGRGSGGNENDRIEGEEWERRGVRKMRKGRDKRKKGLFFVKTTPQKTRFRDVKYARIWDTD